MKYKYVNKQDKIDVNWESILSLINFIIIFGSELRILCTSV